MKGVAFKPGGDFARNIRSIAGIPDDDLRASLKAAGWNKELPAIKDENGQTLVGHRRLKIAEEEGIEPAIKTVTFGEGVEADAARTQLAVVSNIGAAPITKGDRKRLAERLYRDGLTMEAIGKMLGVSQRTISEDLRNFNLEDTSKSKPAKTAANPKGAGRPKQTNGSTDQTVDVMEQSPPSSVAPTKMGGSIISSRDGMNAWQLAQHIFALASKVTMAELQRDYRLSGDTAQQLRDIAAVAEAKDLDESERRNVEKAKDILIATQQSAEAYRIIRPISERLWKGARWREREKIAPRVKQDFDRAHASITAVCSHADRVQVPSDLSKTRRKECLRELSDAITSLRGLKKRIGSPVTN